MFRHLPLLLKLYQTVKLSHLRWAALLFLLTLGGGGSAIGAMTYGWKGGVLVPLLFALSFALLVTLSLALGMHSHRRNRPRAAVLFLAPASLLGRGRAYVALHENRSKVVALMMQKMAMSYLSGPR